MNHLLATGSANEIKVYNYIYIYRYKHAKRGPEANVFCAKSS